MDFIDKYLSEIAKKFIRGDIDSKQAKEHLKRADRFRLKKESRSLFRSSLEEDNK